MFPSYFVINLDSQPKRWKRMQKVSQLIGRSFIRVAASKSSEFDGKSVFSPQLQRPLSSGEMGCFHSHRRIWEMIANGPAPFAFIFEDDALISPRISKLEEFLGKEDFSFDIIHLENPRKGEHFLSDTTSKDFLASAGLFRLLSPAVGTAGLVISKAGAQKLLDCQIPFAPVDEMMFSKYSKIWKSLSIYQTNPVLVWQLDDFESNLPSSLQSTIDNTTERRQFSMIANIKKLLIKIDYLAYLTKYKKKKIKLDLSEKTSLENQLFL